GDIAFHEQVTKFKQHSCSHISVPVHFADANFNEIEANQLSSTCQYFGEEIRYLFCLETTWHRSTCVRAKLAVKAINIETDVYILRKKIDDLICYGLPCFAFIHSPAYIPVEVAG